MSATETAILALLRKLPGFACMRVLHERHPKFALGKFAIVDVGRFDVPVIVQAESWDEVLGQVQSQLWVRP